MSFNESEHPRDKDGKFEDKTDLFKEAEKTVEEEKRKAAQELAYTLDKVKDLKSLLGEEFKGYKGQAAVDKLLKERHGHIKAAFHRDDIGDIDLIWGNDYLGLKHIIQRRTEQNLNIKEFLNSLSDTIGKGLVKRKTSRGDIEIKNERQIVVIGKTYHNNKLTYVLTAFKTR